MRAMGFLQDRKALIVGLASNRSIAWGIAQAMHAQGAELAMTYQNERLADRVHKLGSQLGCEIFMPCDLGNDTEITTAFDLLSH